MSGCVCVCVRCAKIKRKKQKDRKIILFFFFLNLAMIDFSHVVPTNISNYVTNEAINAPGLQASATSGLGHFFSWKCDQSISGVGWGRWK